jgi:hypothetical protein
VKFKIAAGAEIDLLTQGELKDTLRGMMTSWVAEVSMGDRYRRFSAYGDIADSALSIGGTPEQEIGPDEGFVWSVKRLAVTNYDPDAEALGLYINGTDSSGVVEPILSRYNPYDANQLILYPGERLWIAGSSLTSSGRVWVTGQARELPISLLWRL